MLCNPINPREQRAFKSPSAAVTWVVAAHAEDTGVKPGLEKQGHGLMPPQLELLPQARGPGVLRLCRVLLAGPRWTSVLPLGKQR